MWVPSMKVQILFLLVLDNPPKEEPEDDIDASVKRDNKNLIIPEMVVLFLPHRISWNSGYQALHWLLAWKLHPSHIAFPIPHLWTKDEPRWCVLFCQDMDVTEKRRTNNVCLKYIYILWFAQLRLHENQAYDQNRKASCKWDLVPQVSTLHHLGIQVEFSSSRSKSTLCKTLGKCTEMSMYLR